MKIVYYIQVLLFVIYSNVFSQAPNYLWAKSAGGTGTDAGYCCTTDASGNIIVVGGFASSTITFGTNTLTNTIGGTADIYIVKYDPNGNALWARSVGGINLDAAYGCCIDANNNIIVTGDFSSPSITFGTTTLTNTSTSFDIFVVKYDTNGNVIWAKGAGGTSSDVGKSCYADANSNIIVAGTFSSPSFTLGTNTLTNANTGTTDIFITKYDSNGNVIWAKSSGGASNDYVYSCKTDASNNIVIAGHFNSSAIIFGTNFLTNTNSGTADIFIAKYDTNGNVLWAKKEGGTNPDFGISCSIDPSRNIITTGYFNSPTITFGVTTLTNTTSGVQNFYIVKYDSAGNVLWAKNAGGPGHEGSSCTTDASGNIVAIGIYGSSITLGTTTLTSSGLYDVFIVKYDPLGNVLWAKKVGGTGTDYGFNCATDPNGNIVATGHFTSSSMALGTTTLTNAGPGGVTDMFVFKLDGITGIEEYGFGNGISVYPNPSTGVVNISIIQPESLKIKELLIYNILGESILSQKNLPSLYQIDLSEETNGIYFIKLSTEKGTASKKIIITH